MVFTNFYQKLLLKYVIHFQVQPYSISALYRHLLRFNHRLCHLKSSWGWLFLSTEVTIRIRPTNCNTPIVQYCKHEKRFISNLTRLFQCLKIHHWYLGFAWMSCTSPLNIRIQYWVSLLVQYWRPTVALLTVYWFLSPSSRWWEIMTLTDLSQFLQLL